MQPRIAVGEKTPETQNHPKLKFGFTWLLFIPIGLWFLVSYYLPVSGGTLNRIEFFMTTPLIVLFVLASLSYHVFAHVWTARWLGVETPPELTILIFGDASQRWPAANSEWQDLISTSAGRLRIFYSG